MPISRYNPKIDEKTSNWYTKWGFYVSLLPDADLSMNPNHHHFGKDLALFVLKPFDNRFFWVYVTYTMKAHALRRAFPWIVNQQKDPNMSTAQDLIETCEVGFEKHNAREHDSVALRALGAVAGLCGLANLPLDEYDEIEKWILSAPDALKNQQKDPKQC